MKATSGLPKPQHSLLLFAAIFLFLLGFFIAAHESGSGFVQIVGAVLFSMVLTNAVLSFFHLKSSSVTIISVPTDATTNQEFNIVLRGTKNTFLTLPDDEKNSFFFGDEEKEFSIKPSYCGLYQNAEFILSSSYPFGIIALQKKITCSFPNQVYVAPQELKTQETDRKIESITKEADFVYRNSNSGNLKSIVDYQPGDLLSSISWSKTAQTQQILVKTHEEQMGSLNCRIEISIPNISDLDAIEHYLGERLYMIIATMEKGFNVTLRARKSDSYTDFQISNKLQAKRLIASLVSQCID